MEYDWSKAETNAVQKDLTALRAALNRPETPKAPADAAKLREDALKDLGDMQKAIAIAKAAEGSAIADQQARGPAIATGGAWQLQPPHGNAVPSDAETQAPPDDAKYHAILRTPIPQPGGQAIPALRARTITVDRAGIWFRNGRNTGRVFVPFSNIIMMSED